MSISKHKTYVSPLQRISSIVTTSAFVKSPCPKSPLRPWGIYPSKQNPLHTLSIWWWDRMCISYPKARMGHAKEKRDQSQWRALTVWCSVPLPGTQWWNMNFQKVWIALCKDFVPCISWEFSPGLTLEAWDSPQQIAGFLDYLPSRVLTDSLISHSWFCVAPSEGHPACNPNRFLHATCLPRLSTLEPPQPWKSSSLHVDKTKMTRTMTRSAKGTSSPTPLTHKPPRII